MFYTFILFYALLFNPFCITIHFDFQHPDIFKAAFIDRHRPREFDISVDLWSLGATLYHTATGKVPFQPFHGRGDKHTMYAT